MTVSLEVVDFYNTDRLSANLILGEYVSLHRAGNLELVMTCESTCEIHTLTLSKTITGIPVYF